MTVKRGDNIGEGGKNMTRGVVDSALEMQCFEKLGPRTRAAIAAAPIKILAAPIVLDIEKAAAEQNTTCQFNHPKIDAAIASGIRSKTFELLVKERGEEAALAGVTQLIARAGKARLGRRVYR